LKKVNPSSVPPFVAHVVNAHTAPVISRFGSKILTAREMPVVFSRVLGDFFFIYRTKTFEEIEEMRHFIQDT
jgi:hypothetical protein